MKWERLYNDRVNRLVPSIIQEMRSLNQAPGTISLTAGEPSPDLYPADSLSSAFEKVFRNNSELLSYAPPAGDPDLREWVSAWLNKKSCSKGEVGKDRILLTNGSQAGLNILSLMFLGEGRKIILEDPSYTEAMLTFAKEGSVLLTVPMDEEGPVPEAMEKLLEEEKPSFFYTVPTFQNPSGITVSKQRKLAILDIASQRGVKIIEDDPYRELWYDFEPSETYLKLSGGSEDIIYLGSFSKIIAPGVRCGYAVLPTEVMDKAAELRVLLEIGLSSLVQRSIFEFLRDSDFEAHLTNLRQVYRSRRDAMAASLERHLVPLGLDFNTPSGGFFIWGRIPDIDTADFARFAARHEGVGIVPGCSFFAEPSKGREYLRIAFAQVSPEESEEGARRLASALSAYKTLSCK